MTTTTERSRLIVLLMTNLEADNFKQNADNLEMMYNLNLTNDERELIAENYQPHLNPLNVEIASKIIDNVRCKLIDLLISKNENQTAEKIAAKYKLELTENEVKYIDSPAVRTDFFDWQRSFTRTSYLADLFKKLRTTQLARFQVEEAIEYIEYKSYAEAKQYITAYLNFISTPTDTVKQIIETMR